MILKLNDHTYRVYFRYNSIEDFEMKTKVLVHSNNTIQKTCITGTKHIVEAILIHADTNEIIVKGIATCSMHDVYIKRFGMAFAVLELLKQLSQFDGDTFHELCEIIYTTHFSFSKNVPYDMELSSI